MRIRIVMMVVACAAFPARVSAQEPISGRKALPHSLAGIALGAAVNTTACERDPSQPPTPFATLHCAETTDSKKVWAISAGYDYRVIGRETTFDDLLRLQEKKYGPHQKVSNKAGDCIPVDRGFPPEELKCAIWEDSTVTVALATEVTGLSLNLIDKKMKKQNAREEHAEELKHRKESQDKAARALEAE